MTSKPLLTPVLGFAAFSGTGKTTLLSQVIPRLRQQGLRLGLLKHSHHDFEIDRPGKDSFLLRQAGACQVVASSARRTLVVREHGSDKAPGLESLLDRLAAPELDLILVEGFKQAPLAKIELHRPALGHPLLCRSDEHIIALASDTPLKESVPIPVLDLNNPAAIAAFMIEQLRAGHLQVNRPVDYPAGL